MDLLDEDGISNNNEDADKAQLKVSPVRNDYANIGLTRTKSNIALWKRAFSLVKSQFPISSFESCHLDSLPIHNATRHRYSAIKKKWVIDEIKVTIEPEPFDRGSMRKCFRLKKIPTTGSRCRLDKGWNSTCDYVAKHYINPVDREVYFADVRLQMEAKLWAEAYNRQNPPKKVDMFQLSVLELHPTPTDSDQIETTKTEPTLYHIERFMEGRYHKYNSNSGFVSDELRNTPQAFSHFTFERSGHRLLVVDIQGVGDLYTDPQIHTSDGVDYNDCNLGLRGMALFFHSHRCNPLCTLLGLTQFTLSPSELAINNPDSVFVEAGESGDDLEVIVNDNGPAFGLSDLDPDLNQTLDWIEQNVPSDPTQSSTAAGACRRRCISYTNHHQPGSSDNNSTSHGRLRKLSDRFGPTVGRSQFDASGARRRSRFISCRGFDEISSQSIDCLFSGQRRRVASGDSGYYGVGLGHLPLNQPLLPDDDDCLSTTSSSSSLLTHQKRQRQASDSSLVDFDSLSLDATSGPTNSGGHHALLHHLLHDNHRPSSSDHPTNLDQEIGQSILGHIHHELTRLHEAGRFLPRHFDCWKRAELLDGDEETRPTNLTVDWQAVLFHERCAAQLGCLDAMIVMAHYFLGLPSQLLFECPIKATDADITSGLDYLWRSAEGGDRRCAILLARYLDLAGLLAHNNKVTDDGGKLLPAPNDGMILPSLLPSSTDNNNNRVLLTNLPTGGSGGRGGGGLSDAWVESVVWYRRAVQAAGHSTMPSSTAPSHNNDEGFDAEGCYDAAEDLLPIYRLVGRIGEMYAVGGCGLRRESSKAGDLFNEAAELAVKASQTKIALEYFAKADEAYALADY